VGFDRELYSEVHLILKGRTSKISKQKRPLDAS